MLHHSHWLGLFHTFQGGCSSSDGVTDTAPEKEAFYGCGEHEPIDRDTCPDDDKGSDPVHNFMNYSYDQCLYKFSPGQATVMKASYEIFRVGTGYHRESVPLEKGISSEPIFLPPNQRQVFTVESSSNVHCTIEFDEGDAEMYLSWDKQPDFTLFDSSSCTNFFTGEKVESCSASYSWFFIANIWPFNLLNDVRTMYVGVAATDFKPLQDLTITCN